MLENRFKESVHNAKNSIVQESALGTKALESNLPPQPKPKAKPTSFWQRLGQGWENLNFRTKLTILLVSSAALPAIVVTNALVAINQERALREMTKSLQNNGIVFRDDYVLWTKLETEKQAKNLANIIKVTEIDLSNPGQVSARRDLLKDVLKIENGLEPEDDKNFQIFTDAQGRTVAQDIQILQDFSSQPSLPVENRALTEPKYRPVSLPTGIYLGDIPIVKNALRTGRPLAGMELFKREPLQRLGLEKQADIGLRTQPTQNLTESKLPFPEGTYDIDGGKAGLIGMTVYPIKIKNKLVGTVIVGALLNRNYGLVDKYWQLNNVVATIFVQDWRVNTNVPYKDNRTRAIGTRAAREVAADVLNQGQDFTYQTNIVGKQYITFYSPLYDHQKELNPAQAKPVGMAFVGKPLVEVENHLRKQHLIAYGIGGGMWLLVGLLAIPVAGSFARPLRRLTYFAQQVADGKQAVRLETTGRQDEIGVLSHELNQMAVSIEEANLEVRRQDAERANLLADIASSRTLDSQDLEAVFNKALKGAQQILKADRVFLYRFNSDWSGIVIAEAVAPDWPSCLGEIVNDTHFMDSDVGVERYRNGRIFVIDDIHTAELTDCHFQIYVRFGIKANVIVPVVKNNQLMGLICVQQCSGPRAWQQDEVDFVAQLATQVGFSLDRLNFIQQKEAEAQQAELLKDITLKISQAANLQDVLTTAVDNIRSGLKTDRVVIYNLDPTTSQGTVLAESVVSDLPKLLGEEIDDPCFSKEQLERYKKGQVTSINNVYQQPGLTPSDTNTLEQFGVKANMIAPITTGNQLFGLLIAHQCSTSRVWQQGEIDLFGQLATSVGFALDRAHLLYEVEQARLRAENISQQQRQQKEDLQKRAMELLMEVDPVSKGDLTIRANVTEDEIGTLADSYNATISSLRQIVTQVQAAAKQVGATTSSNEVSVQELSQAALQQAQEIAGALDQIQEMSNSIRAVAANASQAEAAVKQATQTVVAGDAAMNRTVDGILAIRETVAETAKKVKRLGESSQKISKVVNLLTTFADQTNLLALNAAIEAARAGEEGRGFAVVADEVRTLAQQSTEATVEIEILVAEIQAETNEVVAAMEAGTQQVATGTKLVDETRQSLNQITATSAQISALVEAIAEATVSQSQASQTVTQTITNVAAIAANNSTSATVVSASFKELLAVAQQLQASVGQFKL